MIENSRGDQTGSPELERAIRFLREFARRRAQRVVELEDGFLALDLRYRASYDHNKLIVTGTPEPSKILEAVETGLGAAGLAHRMVVIEDDSHGQSCRSRFLAAGFRHDVNLVMRLARSSQNDATASARVNPLELADLGATDRRTWRGMFPNAEPETIRQLVERRSTLRNGAPDVMFLGVRDQGGEVVSHADLYRDGPIAQIESLSTLATHTRRGYAGAIVREAIARATGLGCDLIFLIADADDWPQHWYNRLGFEPIGTYHAFVRPAPAI